MSLPRPDPKQPRPQASEPAPKVADEETQEASETTEDGDASQPATEHGTLKPQPRPGLDRRLDGDPEGTHVCAPTDA